MDAHDKQLQQAFQRAAKATGLATKQDLAGLATQTSLDKLTRKVEQGESDILQAINTAFQEHQATLAKQLDRIEKILNAWPPPSYITDPLERVSAIEHRLSIKPTVRPAA